MEMEGLEQLVASWFPKDLNWRGSFADNLFVFTFPELELEVQFDRSEGNRTPITAKVAKHDLSRKKIDKLRADIHTLLQRDDTTSIEVQSWLLLEIVNKAIATVEEHRSALRIQIPEPAQDPMDAITTADLSEVPYKLLGVTAQQLGASFTEPWCVTNCENVLQRDLYRNFVRVQEYLRGHLFPPDEYWSPYAGYQGMEWRETYDKKSRAEADRIERITRPSMTFVGARKDKVDDIVKNGVVTEMQKREHFSFQRAVFCTSDPHSALLYDRYGTKEVTPSELMRRKIVVCATLLGASKQVSDLKADVCDDWLDYVTEDGVPAMSCPRARGLHVVQSTEAVLPVFVLHLDWKENTPESIYKHMRSQVAAESSTTGAKNKGKGKGRRRKELWPGEAKAEKEERKAHAKKHFTYGYGPGKRKGKSADIEAVAPREDDEENWGEYQKHRLHGEVTDRTIWDA